MVWISPLRKTVSATNASAASRLLTESKAQVARNKAKKERAKPLENIATPLVKNIY
jgi:hypothetical protein